MFSPEISWEEQWVCHAFGFREGLAHIPLPNQKEILLLPGPGFGDYSHPTTQLMVQLMAPYVKNQIILDIGCGSGILSLAAAKLGARKIYSIDIDRSAIMHTKKNAKLNRIKINTYLPRSFPEKPVILMNMIDSEQKIAWKQPPFQTLITSGILSSQKETYLQFAKKQNWNCISIEEKENWLGLIFKENL